MAADCLVYDLEDGVAHNRKNIAREMVFDALEASEHRKAEKAVRINAVGSGLEFDDLNVVVGALLCRDRIFFELVPIWQNLDMTCSLYFERVT